MLKNMGIPLLTDIITETLEEEYAMLDAEKAEQLAQALEEQLHPIIKEAIRDAVKDGARRLARDLRARLDAELSLMVREAIDDVMYNKQPAARKATATKD